MKIGLDLSVIQTPHRMRGIGATAINFVKHLPAEAKKEHTFVLFFYDYAQTEALAILNIEGMDYEIRALQKQERINLNFPSKLKKLNGPLNSIRSLINQRKSDPRISRHDIDDLDVYIQFDQIQALPKKHGLKTLVILYDLIPFIMESDYLWNYKTARQHGDSRKSSVRKALLRKQYIAEVKAVCKQASTLVAISNHTKQDFIKYADVNPDKIKVVHLGIETRQSKAIPSTIAIDQYVENSWGYITRPIDLTEKPFILFVGGADPRRRLVDLVAAYNNLKAQGSDIRLVLAGDTMKGSKAIPIPKVQKYIANSAYLDDIVFAGFVSDEQREWLYKHTVAFVYPSVYEGFGLPILEAMQYGTPVVTYRNSSIEEIGRNYVTYADGFLAIASEVKNLLSASSGSRVTDKSVEDYVKKFSWNKTAEDIFALL